MSRVPDGWKLCSIGDVAQKVGSGITPKGGQDAYRASGIPLIRSQNVLWGRLELSDVVYIDDAQHAKMSSTIVRPNDVLLNITGASIGRCAVVPDSVPEANVNQHVCIIRTDEVVPEYLSNCLLSDVGQSQVQAFQAGGNREGLNFQQIRSFSFLFPPLPEQKKIAAILSSVDDAIAATQTVIDQTRKVKEGLLQDLLTRGIGHTRFKQTEIGEIPEGWKVLSLEDCCELVADCKNRTPPATESGYPVVKTTNIRNGRLNCDGLTFTDEASYREWTQRGIPKWRDVIITREAPLGEVCMIPQGLNPCLGQRMMLFRASSRLVLPEFLYVAMLSSSSQKRLQVLAGGSTVGHVRVGDLKGFKIPVPPKEEQEKICSAVLSVDDSIMSGMEKLGVLSGAKRGLMQDLLSGSVRVTL
ncbi:MAG: restriction endonuclease subunit S [Halodesulfovibrio sp.]